MSKTKGSSEVAGVVITLFGLMMVGLIIFSAFSVYQIDAGERGVLLTWGKPSMEVLGEGLGFKLPIAQEVKKVNIQTQKYEASASAASKDLQIVTSTIATNYHLESSQVPLLYQEVGINYQERIIQPLEQEIVKSITAKYTAEELITKREEVRNEIKDSLHDRLINRGIVVEEVSIVNFDFSKSFNDAIEAKVTAEQQKLKAENDLKRIKVEAEQKITQAEAEAESLRIQSNALRENKDVLELRAIEKWDGKLPLVTGGAVPFINVSI